EEGAIDPEVAIEPAGLETDLVVGDRVRLERPILRLAVVAAGSEAGRIGEIDHSVAVRLPRKVELMRLAALLVELLDVAARDVVEAAFAEAEPRIGRAFRLVVVQQLRHIAREAGESAQRVLRLEAADSASEGQARHDVVGQLAEDGIVAVDALQARAE